MCQQIKKQRVAFLQIQSELLLITPKRSIVHDKSSTKELINNLTLKTAKLEDKKWQSIEDHFKLIAQQIEIQT